MQNADLIVFPKWIATVDNADTVLTEHALVICDGVIKDILPADFARQSYQSPRTFDLPEHLVCPGFVNVHTHAAMSLLRGVADDLPLMDWLQGHIWPAEAAHVSPRFCRDGVRLAAAEMIRAGVTTFNDMYFFPDVTAEVVEQCGMRAMIGLIVLDFPTKWASNAEDYLRKGLELKDQLSGKPLIRTALAPHAPYTVSDEPLRNIRKFANELSIPIHMHVHETAFEVADAEEKNGARPWQRLKDLGVVGPDLIAVHMTQLTDEEVRDCAEYGISVAHCPESNLKLASGFCRIGDLEKAGVNIAIGTDGAASNNDLDMLSEIRTAALLSKAVAKDASSFPAHAALRAATMGGAKALGWDDETGSIEKNKSADFICIDMSDVNTSPIFDPVAQLIYAANSRQITHSFVAGKALMENRNLMTLDEDLVLATAHEWGQRIRNASANETAD